MSREKIVTLITEELWTENSRILKSLEELQEDLLWIDADSLFPTQTFIIDRFPKALRYPTSDALDIFYDDCKSKESLLEKYSKIEGQYLEIIQKLWGLSEISIHSNIIDHLDILKAQFHEEKNCIDKFVEKTINSQGQLLKLDNYDDIEFIAKLSLKEKVTSCLVINKLKMVVWINGLALKILLIDQSSKQLLNLICTTHGLYLRK